MSNDTDEIRMPYAPKSSKFKRRTSFVGTVNDPNFLADATGNRRFIPLEIHTLADFPAEDVLDQLWAEAWHRYTAGEAWWPSDGEAKLLSEHTVNFRSKSWIEEELGRMFDWHSSLTNIPERLTATAIYRKLRGSGLGGSSTPNQSELKDIGASVKRYLLKHPDIQLDDGRLMVSLNGKLVNVHNSGGKENGWLMPNLIDQQTPTVAGTSLLKLRSQ